MDTSCTTVLHYQLSSSSVGTSYGSAGTAVFFSSAFNLCKRSTNTDSFTNTNLTIICSAFNVTALVFEFITFVFHRLCHHPHQLKHHIRLYLKHIYFSISVCIASTNLRFYCLLPIEILKLVTITFEDFHSLTSSM